MHRVSLFIVKTWPGWLAVWLLALILLLVQAPTFHSQVTPGEFDFLPADSESLQAERFFRDAFEKDLLRSLVIVTIRRTSRPDGLISEEELPEDAKDRKSDFEFIEDDLRQRLEDILRTQSDEIEGTPNEQASEGDEEASEDEEQDVAGKITTYTDRLLGQLLISNDRQASMVLVELPNDFLDARNASIISAIERLIYEDSA